ncbi:MAG TPA: DUF418 domain-containing protein [Gemmatimonadaceae bacterium]|nr:DUF418 domain-containing protein [Gemmatimonadaceae bacterium]
MFLVHFSERSYDTTGVGDIYKWIVYLFFEERFWAMFGILFGVGFAIQFRRAEVRGDRYFAKYLRRMAALAVFGFIAHGVFGFNVLLGYAAWGIPLILFRRMSVRALLVAVILSASSGTIYGLARNFYGGATKGAIAYQAERDAIRARDSRFLEQNTAAQKSKSYAAVLSARLQHMRWFYAQWFSFLPVNTLTLFLLGLLGLRLGIFDRPEEHRRLIVGLMMFGVVSWAVTWWVVNDGYGLLRTMWLTFTYMGAVLLLVARDRRWLDRLSAFGYAGRMALTNYMIQIAVIDLLFSEYALGIRIHPLVGWALAVSLFLLDVVVSKWWLSRYRFGPFEWIWRCVTYWRVEPLRFQTA